MAKKVRMRCAAMLMIAVMAFCLAPARAYAAAENESYEPELFSDFRSGELTLYAKGAVLIDCDNLRILYGKNANTPMANASTTKILTCILALENGNPDDVVTVSERACKMPKVKLGFSAGDRFSLRDLLYSLMLESHNDSAVAVAEHIGGTVEEFAGMMNEKAKELGCKNSHFVTPNGLDGADEGGAHSTSAYDLSRIMAYCIQNEDFLEITQTASRQIKTVDGKRTYSLNNHNALRTMMDGVVSGKTGFTGDAGYCYVGAWEQDGKRFAFALLACGWPNNKGYKWKDAKKLIAFGDDNYGKRTFTEAAQDMKIPLHGGVRDEGGVRYPSEIGARSEEVELEALLSEKDEITVDTDLADAVYAPAKKGDKVGEERVYLNGCLLQTRDVRLTESADLLDLFWAVRKAVSAYFSCAAKSAGES